MENINQPVAEEKVPLSAKPKKPKLSPAFSNFESSVKLWWKNLEKFIGIFLWGLLYSLLPLVVVLAFFGLGYFAGLIGNIVFTIIGALIAIVGVALAIYFATRFYIVNFLFVKENFSGAISDLYKKTRSLFWPYFWLSILSSVLIILWSLLLIIPGIIFSIFYSLAAYVFFFEGKRGMEAIRRSKSLIKNYWWAVLGRLAFFALVIWLFMIVISIPTFIAGEESTFSMIWSFVIQIISFIIGPIALLYSYNIYKELVEIKK